MNTDVYAIEVNNVSKSYGDLKVLKGIDLKVKRGSVMALLGPNGAGKTTIVKILSTLLKADGGNATIEGHDVVKDADAVRGVIGLTGQYAAIDEYLSGRENLNMMGRLYHLSKKDSRRRTEELLKQFDLVGAADRPAKTYSGGMGRRLDLAASLIAAPPILFLDEPTTGLDPRSRITMWEIITGLVEAGSTILLTTQYLEEADQLADQIAVLDGGKIIAQGTADELKSKVGKERIEFAFATDESFKQALKALPKKSQQSNLKDRTISIANDSGVVLLQDLLHKLSSAGIDVEGLSLHKPTLDDVFLQLTGHVTKSDTPTEQTTKKKKAKK